MGDPTSLAAELQQQIALAYALRDTTAALNSSLDLDEVLDQILANIGWVLPVDAATIMLIEDGVARVVREIGYSKRGLSEWVRALRLPISDIPHYRTMVETGLPVRIADTHNDPLWVSFQEVTWHRSYLGAPIRLKAQTIGFLNLNSENLNFFTPLHAEALQAFADQAATALGNARLFKETQQRLIAQAALLEASQAISSSLDLPTVLNRCAEQLCRAIDATSAYICYWHRTMNTTTTVAEYYSPHASAQEREPDPNQGRPDPDDDVTWISSGQALVRHIDSPETPLSTREHMRQYGVHSLLSIPLTARNQTFGYAALWETRRHREFTAEEMQLCLGIAQQAAIAFDNARLYEAARHQLSLSRILQAVGALLSAEMSLDEVFERLFDLLSEVIHYDLVSIELFDETDRLYLAAQRGFPDPARASQSTRDETGASVRARWGTQSVIVVPDTHTDPRWLRVPDFDFIRSRVAVWLRVKNRVFGILNVDNRMANAYDTSSGETVAAFANQAAIAIENAQLSDAIRQHAAQLEHRVAERTAELDQERRRIRAILDAAGEGIIFTDDNGVIEYINPALEELTGYTATEAQGRTAAIWKSGSTPLPVYQQMWGTIKRGQVWQGEMINRHKSGRLYDTALTIAPLRGQNDQIIGYVGIQRDVSQQKELDRLKDQFVSSVSHEFRAPLANMKLSLSLLESGRPEKREQYVQTLQRETLRLENLIEDLLYISRLDMGATTVRNTPIELHPLIVQLITDRSDLAAEHNLSLDYLPKSDLLPALGDASMIVQVMSNLMSNAINYTPAGGIVTIVTGMQSDGQRRWVTLAVQDTGPGILPQDLPHIFDRFYRGEAARKSGAPGTGLGLSICKQVVEKMDGQLTVESRVGEGAIFTVWLPSAA